MAFLTILSVLALLAAIGGGIAGAVRYIRDPKQRTNAIIAISVLGVIVLGAYLITRTPANSGFGSSSTGSTFSNSNSSGTSQSATFPATANQAFQQYMTNLPQDGYSTVSSGWQVASAQQATNPQNFTPDYTFEGPSGSQINELWCVVISPSVVYMPPGLGTTVNLSHYMLLRSGLQWVVYPQESEANDISQNLFLKVGCSNY